MTAIERIGHAQHGGELVHHDPVGTRQLHVRIVGWRRQRLPMVAHHVGHDRPVAPVEPEDLRVADDVVTVLVVPAGANHLPDIVQNGAHLQHHPVAVVEAVLRAQFVEQAARQQRHVAGVALVETIALAETDGVGRYLRAQLAQRGTVVSVAEAQQCAFANAHPRHQDLLRGRQVQEGTVDEQPGNEQLRVAVGDLQVAHHVRHRQCADVVDEAVEVGAVETRDRLRPAAQRRHREARVAADGDERADAAQAQILLHGRQRRSHRLLDDLPRRDVGAAGELQRSPHAHGPHLEGAQRRDAAALDQNQRGMTAAHLDDQRVGPQHVGQLGAECLTDREIGQLALLHLADHLDRQAGAQRYPVNEGVAVARLAQRAGAEHEGVRGRDVPAGEQLAVGAQHLDAAGQGGAPDAPGGKYVMAQRDRFDGAVDHVPGAVRVAIDDEQTERAGAHVHHCHQVSRSAAGRPPGRCHQAPSASISRSPPTAPWIVASSPSSAATTRTPAADAASACSRMARSTWAT